MVYPETFIRGEYLTVYANEVRGICFLLALLSSSLMTDSVKKSVKKHASPFLARAFYVGLSILYTLYMLLCRLLVFSHVT